MEQYKKRFENHELKEVVNTDEVKIFDFRNKNGSIINYQRWVINKGTLIVLGDNYESVYKWNDSGITLKFLAECNLGYFNEKCRADKDGYSQKVFEASEAEDYLKEIAVERIYDNVEFDDTTEDNWEGMSLEDKFEVCKPYIAEVLDIEEYEVEGIFYADNVHDAYSILSNSEYEFMFGEDAWEYANGLEVLTVVPKLHLTALRVAYEKYPNAF